MSDQLDLFGPEPGAGDPPKKAPAEMPVHPFEVCRTHDTVTICDPSDPEKTAMFSHCRKYRYELWRRWKPGGEYCMFLCLNPSTADEMKDDPTVKRCITYAKDWGFNAFLMTNIFAWRDTDPDAMKKVPNPVGPANDRRIIIRGEHAGIIIAAWGTHGTHMDRQKQIKKLELPNLMALKITESGAPNHPLYLKKDLQPFPYVFPE